MWSEERLCSLLLIKRAFVSVGAKLDPRQPGRRPFQLRTDSIQRHIWAAFDDQLVVDVTADEAVRQRPHGVGQDIAADRLDDVFHEFRAVGFYQAGANTVS